MVTELLFPHYASDWPIGKPKRKADDSEGDLETL